MRTRSLEVIILDLDTSDHGSSPYLSVFLCDFCFVFCKVFVAVNFPV